MEIGNLTLVDIISLSVGILGLIYAIYQGIRANKIKSITKNYCKIRCEDLQAILNPLIDQAQNLCVDYNDFQYSNVPHKKGDIEKSLSKIQVISTLVGQLVRFFKRLNQEYEFEYKDKIFNDIDKVLPMIHCHYFRNYAGITDSSKFYENDINKKNSNKKKSSEKTDTQKN